MEGWFVTDVKEERELLWDKLYLDKMELLLDVADEIRLKKTKDGYLVKVVLEIPIKVRCNDCLFSKDGRCFIDDLEECPNDEVQCAYFLHRNSLESISKLMGHQKTEKAGDKDPIKRHYEKAVKYLVERHPELKDFVEFVLSKGYSASTTMSIAYKVKKHFIDGVPASDSDRESYHYKKAEELWKEFTSRKEKEWVEIDDDFYYREKNGGFEFKYMDKIYEASMDQLKSIYDPLPEVCTIEDIRRSACKVFGDVDEVFAMNLMKFFVSRSEFDADVVFEYGRLKMKKA